MHQHDFTQLLKHYDLLDPAQIEEARVRISNVRGGKEALAQIEGGAGARECPHCGSAKRPKGARRARMRSAIVVVAVKRPSVDALAHGLCAFIGQGCSLMC